MSMIDIVVDVGIKAVLPTEKTIIQAIMATLQATESIINAPQLCIRFSSDHEVQALNAQWRDKNSVTDVLSFPMQADPNDQNREPLGDIVLAVPFVHHEAKRLNIDNQAHILHLIVHGMLHLLGYDHVQDNDMDIMQALESKIMKTLHLHNPYPNEGHFDV